MSRGRGREGEPLWDSYVRTLCKRLAAKAGVEKRVHPHGFRHGWALGQVESGTSLPRQRTMAVATSRP